MRLTILVSLLVALATTNVLAHSAPSPTSAGEAGAEPIVPAAEAAAPAGKLFVFTKNSGLGGTGYTKFAAAAQKAHEAGSTLPATLAGYSCVILSVNRGLAPSDVSALATYAQAGGHLVAVGEYTAFAGTANAAMNQVAEAAGSSIRIRGGSIDLGFHETQKVDPSTLTLGVTKLKYAAAGEVAPGEFGFSMVREDNGVQTILAGQQTGLGYLVVSGDSNMLSDGDGGAYATHDNGALASQICNGVVALGVPRLV